MSARVCVCVLGRGGGGGCLDGGSLGVHRDPWLREIKAYRPLQVSSDKQQRHRQRRRYQDTFRSV